MSNSLFFIYFKRKKCFYEKYFCKNEKVFILKYIYQFFIEMTQKSKIIFLIAPSESKNTKNEKYLPENLSFHFSKPKEIAENATEKDLKCSGKRYDEAMLLNLTNGNTGVLDAISRYNGVQFKHLDYENLSHE